MSEKLLFFYQNHLSTRFKPLLHYYWKKGFEGNEVYKFYSSPQFHFTDQVTFRDMCTVGLGGLGEGGQ